MYAIINLIDTLCIRVYVCICVCALRWEGEPIRAFFCRPCNRYGNNVPSSTHTLHLGVLFGRDNKVIYSVGFHTRFALYIIISFAVRVSYRAPDITRKLRHTDETIREKLAPHIFRDLTTGKKNN